MVVRRHKLDEAEAGNATHIHEVKLGQLGFGIKMRRIFGRIRVIYVLYPRAPPYKSPEMAKYNGNGTVLAFTQVARVQPLTSGALEPST